MGKTWTPLKGTCADLTYNQSNFLKIDKNTQV